MYINLSVGLLTNINTIVSKRINIKIDNKAKLL